MRLYVCRPKTIDASDFGKVELRSFPRDGEDVLGTIEAEPFTAFLVLDGTTCGVRVNPLGEVPHV